MEQTQVQETQKPKSCGFCEKESQNLKACTACNKISYCNVECQKQHWKKHKQECTFKSKKQQKQENLAQTFQQDPSAQSFQQFQKEFEQKASLQPNKYTQFFAERIQKQLEKEPISVEYETVVDESQGTGHKVLTIPSLAKIQSAHGQICKDELIEIELENRKNRREILNNKDDLEKSYKEYSKQIVNLFMEKDVILKSAQVETLTALKVNVKDIELALKMQGKIGKQREIQEIMGKLMQEQKAVLKSKNPITDVTKIEEVFEFQQNFIEKESDLFQNFISTVSMPLQQMQDIIPFIISSLLLDKTYEKFSIEEEDFFEFLTDNKNWNDKLVKMEEAINNGTYKIISNYLQKNLKLQR